MYNTQKRTYVGSFKFLKLRKLWKRKDREAKYWQMDSYGNPNLQAVGFLEGKELKRAWWLLLWLLLTWSNFPRWIVYPVKPIRIIPNNCVTVLETPQQHSDVIQISVAEGGGRDCPYMVFSVIFSHLPNLHTRHPIHTNAVIEDRCGDQEVWIWIQGRVGYHQGLRPHQSWCCGARGSQNELLLSQSMW